MRRIFQTLIVCTLLIAGAATPALAAGHSHEDAVSAQSIHLSAATDGHTP